ncbi:MAG: polynucleotide adenylyltransferase PcnB [Gammaproteobacteria bacterium]
MPKRLVGFLNRVFGGDKPPKVELRVIPRDQHGISRKNISPAALKVLYRLKDAGYEAYLVGGGVRDLLLEGKPKDFDVATSATPEQVKRVFNNCRLVGRRFRLAHILFGRDVIEVATFRAAHLPDDPGDDEHVPDDEEVDAGVQGKTGMILRDNVWGNVEQDAIRRDFTVNALYYNVEDFAIHDYVGGLKDLEKRRLRLIGDPETRYREDPVRMLRAARFAAKLGFTVEDGTAKPIEHLRPLLHQVPAARLFDETLKLLLAGHGRAGWDWLVRFRLDEVLFPDAARACRHHENARRFVHAALDNSDRRIHDGKTVTPAFLFAALLWPEVCQRFHALIAEGMQEIPAMAEASQQVLDAQCRIVAIPRRFSVPAREIWDMQLRLPRRNGRRADALLDNPRFRAAYDFLLLREAAGPLPGEPADIFAGHLGTWWTDYQNAGPDARLAMASDLDARKQPPGEATGQKRRRRRRR